MQGKRQLSLNMTKQIVLLLLGVFVLLGEVLPSTSLDDDIWTDYTPSNPDADQPDLSQIPEKEIFAALNLLIELFVTEIDTVCEWRASLNTRSGSEEAARKLAARQIAARCLSPLFNLLKKIFSLFSPSTPTPKET